MECSELDLFVLSLVSQGLATPYALKMRAGLSVGSTKPVLDRLENERLIKAGTKDSRGSRRFVVTDSGKKVLRTRFTALAESQPTDIDAILRIAHLSACFASEQIAKRVLKESARRLDAVARQRAAEAMQSDTNPRIGTAEGFRLLRTRCDAARLLAQAGVLAEAASGGRKAARNRNKSAT